MEDFVSFELAVKLKGKGFDKETVYYYNDKGQICVSLVDEEYPYPCPTISQILKWLRKEKKIHIGIIFTGKDYTAWIQPLNTDESQITIHNCDSTTEAEIAGIESVLDNLI